jgi:hypothetical protein
MNDPLAPPARGWPFSKRALDRSQDGSLPARGWPCRLQRLRWYLSGSPARAGMIPSVSHPASSAQWFPRLRGDGPGLHAKRVRQSEFPRLRGDGPSMCLNFAGSHWVPPPARGWPLSLMHRCQNAPVSPPAWGLSSFNWPPAGDLVQHAAMVVIVLPEPALELARPTGGRGFLLGAVSHLDGRAIQRRGFHIAELGGTGHGPLCHILSAMLNKDIDTLSYARRTPAALRMRSI